MGGKKTGPEMVAEALRDVAILVTVFYPLDIYVGSRPVNLKVSLCVLVGCIVLLLIGIVIERVRRREDPGL
jgi:uncharacterized membrane protein